MNHTARPLVSSVSSFLSSVFIVGLVIWGFYWFYSRLWYLSEDNTLPLALGFLLLSDGVYLLIHLGLRTAEHRKYTFSPEKLSVVLATYNSENVITRTIDEIHIHIPLAQIIVISDTSTDNTVQVAKNTGVRVYENEVNLNKALTISRISPQIKTSYTLILDDDTFIGNTFIPTNLLDEGYDAVAFNVMPEVEDSLVNQFQQFEYRKTMFLTKDLRSASCSVGNVSGAIGLYHTKNIVFQSKYHSGLFGGEDQERTTLTYLYGTGKGIKYCDSLVLTEAPHTWRQLFRQRGVKFGGGWGAAHINSTVLYLKLLFSRRANLALKFEKAYQLFIVFTDPLRIVFFPLLFLDPFLFIILYAMYLGLELILWCWTKRQDSIWVVLLSPLYGMFNSIARFVSVGYWIQNRYEFIFKKKFHRLVSSRSLVIEYSFIVGVLIVLWLIVIIQMVRFVI